MSPQQSRGSRARGRKGRDLKLSCKAQGRSALPSQESCTPSMGADPKLPHGCACPSFAALWGGGALDHHRRPQLLHLLGGGGGGRPPLHLPRRVHNPVVVRPKQDNPLL